MVDLETTFISGETDRVELLVSMFEHAESGYVVTIEEKKTLGGIYRLVWDERVDSVKQANSLYIALMVLLLSGREEMSETKFKKNVTSKEFYDTLAKVGA